MTKDRSPFSPGQPVAPEFFTGRREHIELMERMIRQAAGGRSGYVFITGERGLGKSSLAALAAELAIREHGFIAAHAMLGGARTLGEACRRLYQSLLSQLPEKSLMDKARSIFERYVDRVELFGLGVEFKRDERTRADLVENFLPLMQRMWDASREEGRRGVLLIADDLNGISDDASFAHFVKSTVDQIAVGPMRNFPWILVLVGIQERMENLKQHQPSIERIFTPVELSLMGEADAIDFFERSFDSVSHSCEPKALQFMAKVVGGHPVMWHELGEAVFWADEDERIDFRDVGVGIVEAADNVGRKYLKRQLYDELRSDVYRNILDYIGTVPLGVPIERKIALSHLSEREARNFDNFVQKMRNLGVLKQGDARGEYRFTSFLYHFYVFLQTQARHQQQDPTKG